MLGNNIEKHAAICKKLTEIYEKKNHDYGDSFHKSFEEWGMTMVCIRLGDKLNRLTSLSKTLTNRAMVVDESVEDTLMDLANYAIMTLMELDHKNDTKSLLISQLTRKSMSDVIKETMQDCCCKLLLGELNCKPE